MKRIIFLFSTVFLFLSTKAQVMWQISEDTVITWNYADGDEEEVHEQLLKLKK